MIPSALDETVALVLRRAAETARPADRDKSFLERRLSTAVVEGLEDVFGHELVREGKKLAGPDLPGWNPQPGAIDVAVVTSGNAPRLAFELKVDDVEWTLWDLYKMVAATETPTCDAAYLACALRLKHWESHRDCVELFREPDDDEGPQAAWHSSFLFKAYAKSWAQLLADGTGRLMDVAELVYVSWIGRWTMANYPGYELRAVRVSGMADQRLHFEAAWPIPHEVTYGLITDAALRFDHLPARDAHEQELQDFALTFDGYREFGSHARLARLAKPAIGRWRQTGELPQALTDLRGCLFFEQRQWHHYGDGFDEETMRYVRALIVRMREELTRV